MPFSIRPYRRFPYSPYFPDLWKSSLLLNGSLLFIVLILTGCEGRSLDAYLYGPAKSCYRNTVFASVKDCDDLKVYDTVVIQANGDRQEVVYLMKGLGLDESNSIFRRLDNCKVINRDNFWCDGLVRIDRRFANTEAFGDKVISSSYPAYLTSNFVKSSIRKGTLEFLDSNDSWINIVAIIILLFFFFLGALG